jgi:hypothetical protein
MLHSLVINAQVVDWENFSEEKMNSAMFIEMNRYVKSIHDGDSLILSKVIQEQIMPKNYALIKKNKYSQLDNSHNLEWLTPGRGNDLPDTIRAKIIAENANPFQLNNKWMEKFNCYGLFCYTEILESVSYRGFENGQTYQSIANKFIKGWHDSPPHRGLMEAHYHNKVIVGVTTFFDSQTRIIYISFVHVS